MPLQADEPPARFRILGNADALSSRRATAPSRRSPAQYARNLLDRVRLLKEFEAVCPLLSQYVAVARGQHHWQIRHSDPQHLSQLDAADARHHHIREHRIE